MTEVNISQLSLEQLGQIKKQLETEAGQLSSNVQTLGHAEDRYKNGREALKHISKKNEGKLMDRCLSLPFLGVLVLPAMIPFNQTCTSLNTSGLCSGRFPP